MLWTHEFLCPVISGVRSLTAYSSLGSFSFLNSEELLSALKAELPVHSEEVLGALKAELPVQSG